MYKAILLDFDDTLYDTHGNAQIALEIMYNEFALDKHFPSFEDFSIPYWNTNVELWALYAQGEITRDYLILERFRRPLTLGKGLDVTTELCLSIGERFLDCCTEQTGVIDGAYHLLDYLKGKGYPLYMASNGFTEVQSRKLARVGMTDYFDGIILSEAVGANKPSPLFFEYALKQTGLEAKDVIMIGDNYNTDIIGAMLSGIDQIYFNPEGKPLQTSDSIPTHTVAALKEIENIL